MTYLMGSVVLKPVIYGNNVLLLDIPHQRRRLVSIAHDDRGSLMTVTANVEARIVRRDVMFI